MPQFYEIGLFSGIGYISLFLFLPLAFFCGRILPMGLGIIPFPFIVELILSIYYIKISIENKKMHFLCVSVIIFIIAFIAGINVDNYERENTRKNLINAANIIEEYKLNNGREYFMENDIDNIIVPKNIRIDLTGNTYRIFFKDGIYNSETKAVHFRSRP